MFLFDVNGPSTCICASSLKQQPWLEHSAKRNHSFFELVRRCVPVAESKEGYLAENPFINKMPHFEDLPRATLDASIEEALTKLGELNDRRITSSIHEPDEKRVQQVAYWET